MARENWNHLWRPHGAVPWRQNEAGTRTNGTWRQRFANREARIAWQKDRNATNTTFPGGH